jgi:myo-inositol 2-dehydrogenase / D-chiro-inositol 1-dehydrogenase
MASLPRVTIRVGVIGTGNMGADHANTLHRYVRGATVTVVMDAQAQRAATVAEAIPGARVARSEAALIDADDVDAVIITSPDPSHAGLTMSAVRAGKPVMCEKPLAQSVDECLRVVKTEDGFVGAGSNRLVSVGFMRRFDPGYTQMKASIEARENGAPLLLHCTSRGVSAGAGTTSEMSIKGSAVHEFDIVPWLLGDPIADVSWYTPRPPGHPDGLADPQVMLLRTAGGTLATVETFMGAGYGYDINCELVSERGALALAYRPAVLGNAGGQRFTTHPLDWRARFADAYRLELQAWVDALISGSPPPLATARDGMQATAVAEAAVAAMNGGGGPVVVKPVG